MSVRSIDLESNYEGGGVIMCPSNLNKLLCVLCLCIIESIGSI